MGDPRRLHKKYSKPGHPWQKERLQEELPYMGKYGLRNKRELWKHKTQISRFRQLARKLLGFKTEKTVEAETILIKKLSSLGLISETASLDDILSLTVEDILNRRLQTIVFKKGLANTIYQSRQLITHGHIAVNGKVLKNPGYLVPVSEEAAVDYAFNSPVKNKINVKASA
ncbi:MAG: 30S ribosomal protein S4 [Candidatus Odinarchaeum yellowstonii]|uniref:Small ribosomal subunit protein uS4 n=1 Tax=Odinarchaeota yellowstonii (strain LCB_4) TaxID=1841599 RepID=A0AAF0D1J1_ODILC|nr:MAG: 30S ribosomal protein S4 [Candidatus Odinarchaeum yellowstonii]